MLDCTFNSQSVNF